MKVINCSHSPYNSLKNVPIMENRKMFGRKEGRTDGWTDGQTDTDRQTDRQTGRQTEGRKEGRKEDVVEHFIIKISYKRGPVREGMHIPRLNFKSCHVAISEGPYVAVGISSTATSKF